MKKKCEQYWPDEVDGTVKPGCNLSVTMTSFLPFAEYVIRKLLVKDVSGAGQEQLWCCIRIIFLNCSLLQISNPSENSLEVTQFHYQTWPDHGVPTNAMSLVNFIKQVNKVHPPSHKYPLLVHCSAGVGRTGTFIVLDSMMQRIKTEENVNIFEFVMNLRTKRMRMVQHEVFELHLPP